MSFHNCCKIVLCTLAGALPWLSNEISEVDTRQCLLRYVTCVPVVKPLPKIDLGVQPTMEASLQHGLKTRKLQTRRVAPWFLKIWTHIQTTKRFASADKIEDIDEQSCSISREVTRERLRYPHHSKAYNRYKRELQNGSNLQAFQTEFGADTQIGKSSLPHQQSQVYHNYNTIFPNKRASVTSLQHHFPNKTAHIHRLRTLLNFKLVLAIDQTDWIISRLDNINKLKEVRRALNLPKTESQ